jgi:hypothetical protein
MPGRHESSSNVPKIFALWSKREVVEPKSIAPSLSHLFATLLRTYILHIHTTCMCILDTYYMHTTYTHNTCMRRGRPLHAVNALLHTYIVHELKTSSSELNTIYLGTLVYGNAFPLTGVPHKWACFLICWGGYSIMCVCFVGGFGASGWPPRAPGVPKSQSA